MAKYHHPAHAQYDCTDRSIRDWVRSRHDITEDEFNILATRFFPASNPDLKQFHFDDLNLSEGHCHNKLIEIYYDPSNGETNEDINMRLIDWPDSMDEPVDPNDGFVHCYFSDMYFNASKLHFGMTTLLFSKAKNNLDQCTIAMKFRGSLAWHHGNITSELPLDKTGKFLP